ncbi:hypothetical protein [Pseudomonas violetae]|jgi:hypothetical protein|uniref:Uncharacterized protein n=1 Tax=Pseudomonas violetae TaxID=2915813 RepID=A0ABT0F1V3_9PSED|nr:hypothetical protein [Pseudomonas violetae]MCK1791987.1 hypothetical protein [Pseudomonas violetae]
MLHSQKDIEKCVISTANSDIGQAKDIYFDDHARATRFPHRRHGELIVRTQSADLAHFYQALNRTLSASPCPHTQAEPLYQAAPGHSGAGD